MDKKQLLVFIHLSQLAGFVFPFGGIIVPTVIWILKKDEIPEIEDHGRDIVNFQISMFIWLLISSILILVLVGYLLLIFIAIISVAFPIVNSIRVRDNYRYNYPLTINFL